MAHGFYNFFSLCLGKSEECKEKKKTKAAARISNDRHPTPVPGAPFSSVIATPQSKGNSALGAGDGGKIKHAQIVQILA